MRCVSKSWFCGWLLVGTVAGADPLCAARQSYYAAVAGNPAAARQATAAFEARLREVPGEPLSRAYLGSLRMLEGARTWVLPRKLALVQEGLRLLDEAVTAQPGNAEIRFLRAASAYHLPPLFGRRAQVEEDFAWLTERVLQEECLPAELAAATLFFDGQIRRSQRDRAAAAARFREAHRRWPDTPAGQDAARELARLRL